MNNQTRLGQILQVQGLTQTELAKKSHLSLSMVNRIVSGERSGSIHIWKKIADALNMKIDDLVYYGGDDNAQT